MILVSGGAGYIGSHTCVELIEAGYEIVVADNLINSSEEAVRRVEKITGKKVPFVKCELCDPVEVKELFRNYPNIDAVIQLTSSIYQRDFRAEGRCAKNLGIEGMSKAQVTHFFETGER